MAPDAHALEKTYLAIDLKSFYASVECADRGLDPFATDLVVADPTRSPNTICLAITPALKAKGVRNRCRVREIPQGIPYITAMPRMHRYMEVSAQVAIGKRECVHVFGDDYNTPDGTGVRDYIHVCDLATGHAAALNWMNGRTGVEIFNLGTGKGTSVLEIIKAFSRACGKDLPYQIDPRRPGDVDANYADCSKAKREMGWEAKYTIDDMCRDSWNWQCKNPNGYEG